MKKDKFFDRSLKIIGRHYSDVFLKILFPDLNIQVLGTTENVELNLATRPVDFVHQIEYDKHIYTLHLEFQLRHEANFPRRFCYYHGALGEQFARPVLSIAIYIQPRRSPIPNEYIIQLGDQVINRFTYPVIKLWEYVEEIKNGQYWQFAPLLVTLVRQPTESVLNLERELILTEADEKRRADLMSIAVTIANRYFDRNFLWKFFSKEVELMRQSSILEEMAVPIAEEMAVPIAEKMAVPIAEKMAVPIAEKMAERKMKLILEQEQQVWARQTILRTLQIRFAPSEADQLQIKHNLERIHDLVLLSRLADATLQAFSFAEFKSKLHNIIS